MNTETRNRIREAVKLAVAYWPNSHLGDYTAREDIRSAFTIIRGHAERGDGLHAGIANVESSAYRHMDM